MNIDEIPVEQTVEVTREAVRKWVNEIGEGPDLDQLVTALDYAAGEFDKADGCKFVLIKVV